MRTLLLQMTLFVSLLFPTMVSAETRMKIVSFNVWNNAGSGTEDDWFKRKDGVIKLLLEEHADFIGAQEVFLDKNRDPNRSTSYLENNLNGYGMCARNLPKDWEPCALNPIFYLKKKWELDAKDSGTFWMSPTPEKVGSNGWGNTESRIVNWGLFHSLDEEGKRTRFKVYVFNAHFDHQNETSRRRSAVLLLERIASREHKDAPIVVLGDFNCGESSTAVNYLKGLSFELDGKTIDPPVKFRDTFRDAKPSAETVSTFHGFAEKPANEKIDYIFVAEKFTTVEADIILKKLANGRLPSDHYPISATVTFPD